ncbi:MAG: DegT/DnrJ/EryC1/StrS family aminotransferase, partial [Halobacteriaceae archaeon]
MGEDDQNHISLGKPIVGDDELKNIDDVFDTGWVLNGPTTREFEDAFAEYIGSEYAVSVVNCTAGMQMALDAVGLSDNATVILPGQSFIANGIAVKQNGFDPLFVDVDPETVNLTPEAVKKHADQADAVLLIHYAGYPCEIDAIVDIAED